MSMRIGIVMNMIAPYTTPVFERLAARPGCDIFVVYETPMEPSRRWQPKVDLPYGHKAASERTSTTGSLWPDARRAGCQGRLKMHPFAPVENAPPLVGSVCRAGEAGPGWVVKARERS